MCLERLDDFEPCEVGYKVFRVQLAKLYGESCDLYHERNVNVWLNANQFGDSRRKYITMPDGRKRYPVGFHVFHTRKVAKEWIGGSLGYVIKKVKCKHPVATGYQYGEKVTVCKKIFIIGGKK